MAAGVVVRVTYGYTMVDEDDHFMQLAEEANAVFRECARTGAWPVDFFPICGCYLLPSCASLFTLSTQGIMFPAGYLGLSSRNSLKLLGRNWIVSSMSRFIGQRKRWYVNIFVELLSH
jgi:hypothetical protein